MTRAKAIKHGCYGYLLQKIMIDCRAVATTCKNFYCVLYENLKSHSKWNMVDVT
jgi:hypothetical protein